MILDENLVNLGLILIDIFQVSLTIIIFRKPIGFPLDLLQLL
jgi:hypothetical protein